jgi:hypothetical protein
MWPIQPAKILLTHTQESRPAPLSACPFSATICGSLPCADGAKSKKCSSSELVPTGRLPVLARVACLMAFARLAFAPSAPFSPRARLHGTLLVISSVNAHILSLPHATFPATMRPFASFSLPSTMVTSAPASLSWMPLASVTSP